MEGLYWPVRAMNRFLGCDRVISVVTLGEVVGSEEFKIAVGPKEHAKRNIGRKRQSVFEPLEDDVPPVPRQRPVHRKPFRPVSNGRYLNRSHESDE